MEVDELVTQHERGDDQRIAHTFGVHRTTVMSHLDGRNVQRLQIVRKMTDEQVAAAARRYGEGLSLTHRRGRVRNVHARTSPASFGFAGPTGTPP